MLRDMKKEEDDTYVRSRAEDRSSLLAVSYTLEKYKPIIWIALAFAAAAGFGFQTPMQKFKELDDHMLATVAPIRADIILMKARQDASLNDRIDQRKMLEFLMRASCTQMSSRQIDQLAGGEACYAAAHPLEHAQQAGTRAPGEPNQ